MNSGFGTGVEINVGFGNKEGVGDTSKLDLGPSGLIAKVSGWGVGIIEFIGVGFGIKVGIIVGLKLGNGKELIIGLVSNESWFFKSGEIETKGLGFKETKALGLGEIKIVLLLNIKIIRRFD